MFEQIVYLPKFGRELFSGMEQNAIEDIRAAGEDLGIPVLSWEEYMDAEEVRERSELNQKLSSLLPVKNYLFISLGGDGTMLTAMRAAAKFPGGTVLGVNFGHLGFLTSIDGSRAIATGGYYQRLIQSLVEGDDWVLDNRMTIDATIQGPIGDAVHSTAVNEFLVTTPTRRNPLRYDIYINEHFVHSQSGDGVIITTASGSTAYSMSAGGAIMSPTSKSMQIVPLAAFTLSSRPIVVSENDKIHIRADLSDQRPDEIIVLNDGQQAAARCGNTFDMTVSKKQFVGIWRPKGWNFFNILSEKMGWGK